LDALKTATDVISHNKDIQSDIRAIAKKVEGPLMLALILWYDKVGPIAYAKTVASRSVLTIGIIGMKDKLPSFVYVDFRADYEPSGKPKSVTPNFFSCPSDCPSSDPIGFALMGYSLAAQKIIRAGGFWTNDIPSDARRIIDIEIKDVPDAVGPPVDVLKLDSHGIHWVPPYGECHK
jgi:hypothetical protein